MSFGPNYGTGSPLSSHTAALQSAVPARIANTNTGKSEHMPGSCPISAIDTGSSPFLCTQLRSPMGCEHRGDTDQPGRQSGSTLLSPKQKSNC